MNPIAWYNQAGGWASSSLPKPSRLLLHMAVTMLRDISFVCSLLWIFFRIWQVYQKPVDELVELLGLDIPPVPEASLAGVFEESVLLYFKPSENQPPSLKHFIQVNGIKVGQFGRADTSISVTGLKPGHYYNIRVIATNTANFSTLGPLIRLRTVPLLLAKPNGSLLAGDTTTVGPPNDDEPAAIRTNPSHVEFSSLTPSHQMIREFSSGQNHNKRVASARRTSPIMNGTDNPMAMAIRRVVGEDDESEETIQHLTERLNSLRREQQEVDRQIFDDEQEAEKAKAELIKERDSLKQVLKEKEEASSELRKHGNYLDKLNRTAQSKKAAKEKILQQKRVERQKMKDDMVRWSKEIIEMRRDTEDMKNEKITVIEAKDENTAKIRNGIAEDQALIKSLEENIRLKGIQIKSMEKEKEKPEAGQGEADQERVRMEREKDQAWEVKIQARQAQLGVLWQAFQQVEADHQQAQERLAWWTAKRARDPSQFVPIPSVDFNSFPHSSRQRRTRQANSRTSTMSSHPGNYPIGSSTFTSISSISPSFSSTSPFFSMGNGTAVPHVMQQPGIAQRDADILAGGAPMSPAASDLLPSNLFREDDNPGSRSSVTIGQEPSNSRYSDSFTMQALSNIEATSLAAHSPVSASSRAPSIFSSPHNSLHNLPGYQTSTEHFVDSDRRPVTSTSIPLGSAAATDTNPLAASRLASLFTTFNRQRGKSGTTREAPLLGTLKQGQSQSFPRNLEQGILDPIGTRRRRGSYGNWANPMAGLLNRGTAGSNDSPGDNISIASRTGSGRRSRLNVFSPKLAALESSTVSERPSSPRPSSTYSFEHALPRPSVDSQRFGWPVSDSVPNRNSPLGANWSATSGPWSRGPSRRPSVQHESTTDLSIGSTPLEPESYKSTLTKKGSEQMPIGTRPQSAQQPVTPRLNPAAPTFKTLFNRSDAKKVTKADKALETSSKKENENVEGEETNEESFPPNPRLSRDSQSIATSHSVGDSYDSLDRSDSGTPSDAVTPSTPKETLMQKITRKSSSSKFNVPWAKERSSIFSKKTGEPSTPDEVDEDISNDGQFGKSVDSVPSTPQPEKSNRGSISWPNIRRKSKKGDKALVDAFDKAGEAGDDDET